MAFKIFPSIISANFLNLKKNLKTAIENGIECIHYDIMDNNFVPNLTMGSDILKDIQNEFNNLRFDLHFMVKVLRTENIGEYLQPFIIPNVEQITFHIESLNEDMLNDFINFCKINNIKCGLAISPDTPWETTIPYLKDISTVMFMSVYPGFGGQMFIEKVLTKINAFKKYLKIHNLDVKTEIDGGINNETIAKVKKVGLDIIVVGSYLFGKEDFLERKKKLFDEK